jgi:osmotically-inducible protein OsmY
MTFTNFDRRFLAAAVLGAALFLPGCSHLGDKSAGQTIDDAAIVTKAKAAFVADPVVKAMDIKVNSYKGEVQLSGFARNAEEARRAEELVRGISGVNVVRNDIRLTQK